MIVIDAVFFISALLVGFCAVALWKDLQTLKAAKKTIEALQEALIERDRLVLRLTHELEKHGCDDELLITEARSLCEPIESANNGTGKLDV